MNTAKTRVRIKTEALNFCRAYLLAPIFCLNVISGLPSETSAAEIRCDGQPYAYGVHGSSSRMVKFGVYPLIRDIPIEGEDCERTAQDYLNRNGITGMIRPGSIQEELIESMKRIVGEAAAADCNRNAQNALVLNEFGVTSRLINGGPKCLSPGEPSHQQADFPYTCAGGRPRNLDPVLCGEYDDSACKPISTYVNSFDFTVKKIIRYTGSVSCRITVFQVEIKSDALGTACYAAYPICELPN